MSNVFDKKRLPKSPGDNKTTKQKHIILIVDDEEHMLKSLESIFNEDYTVITARGGQEALDWIKTMKHPEKISVIISDQRMPKL
ncbi:MAG: response regulator, partial [Acidobacteria bacterium]|nr:response regulator [Acidobacteriota bacterium]